MWPAKGLPRPDDWNKFLLSTLAPAGPRGLLLPWARTGSDEHPGGESSKGQLGPFFLGLPSGITSLVLGGPGSLLGAVEGHRLLDSAAMEQVLCATNSLLQVLSIPVTETDYQHSNKTDGTYLKNVTSPF